MASGIGRGHYLGRPQLVRHNSNVFTSEKLRRRDTGPVREGTVARWSGTGSDVDVLVVGKPQNDRFSCVRRVYVHRGFVFIKRDAL